MSQGNVDKSQLGEDKPVLGSNPLLMNKTGLSIKNVDDEDLKSEDSEIKEELTPEEDFRLCGQ